MSYQKSRRVQAGRGCSLGAVVLLESRALLSAIPVGGALLANNSTSYFQQNAATAMDSAGNYIVAWTSNQNGSDYDIYARRYNVWGSPVGNEFRVNSSTSGDQISPSVGMDGMGNFVVSWLTGDSLNGRAVIAQRYNSAGVAQGGEVPLTTPSSYTNATAVGMGTDGDYVITWVGYNSSQSISTINARRFASNGTALGPAFRVDSATTGYQLYLDVAVDSAGSFMVAWYNSGTGAIMARGYNSLGSPRSSPFVLSSSPGDSSALLPRVAMDDMGHFVSSWIALSADTGSMDVYAALGTVDGKSSTPFRVNSMTGGNTDYTDVAMNGAGEFVVTWSAAQPSFTGKQVFAQQFDVQGVPWGSQIQVSRTPITNSIGHTSPSVAIDPAGDFVVAWHVSLTTAGNNNDVYSQFFANKSDYVGVKRSTSFYLDSNHNDNYDTFGTNSDGLYALGNPGDLPLIGDWNGDGFDDIGVWRAGGFYLDANGNGTWNGTAADRYGVYGLSTDTPIVGDWDGDGVDEIGVWRAGVFYLDTNRNRTLDAADVSFAFGAATDVPIIGDWNGDGKDDVGVWRAGLFYQDLNGNRRWDRTPVDRVYSFGLDTDTPIVGDWNGDGKDDIGVKRAARFWIDGNANGKWDGAVDDYFIDFGNASGDVPLVGYWRPKVVPGTPPAAPAGITTTASFSEQTSAPLLTASQIDSGATRKSGTAQSTALTN